MDIRRSQPCDINGITTVYELCFPNEESHGSWVEASMNSYPRGIYYVIESNDDVVGYVLWCVKNGFRSSTIIELEQVAIAPDFHGKGYGRALIEKSFGLFKGHVLELGYKVGAVMVTTSEGNYAEDLYISALGVARSAVLQGYGSGNEIILYNNSIC
ncbi:MAG: GNAT superfamily N-acetyltransferase [Flavobacteriales bacterium]|jgi:GNAT superfamily N-acetyltransferase